MQTQFFTKSTLSVAAHLLRSGELVAFPTETVYGLGADATNCQAVEKIFAVKGRPIHNPLIVHLASLSQIHQATDCWNESQQKLAKYFWPGPLTIIANRNPQLCPLVSAGLSSIAIRIPEHLVALELLALVGKPIAAPSANLSGRPSPTTPEMVIHDLKGKIAGILKDNHKLSYGLESSVVKLDEVRKILFLLREGAVSKEELQKALPDFHVQAPNQQEPSYASPGTRYAHYRPYCPVNLIPCHINLGDLDLGFNHSCLAIFCWKNSQDLIQNLLSKGWDKLKRRDETVLTFIKLEKKVLIFAFENLQDYAKNYYLSLFEAEQQGCQSILAQQSELTGIGAALQNRLQKSSEKF